MMIIIMTILLSVLSAVFKDGFIDNLIRIMTIIGICVPIFWLGFMLLLVFAVKIPIFDVVPNIKKSGYSVYILPVITLSFPYICSGTRMLRGLLLSEYSSDYTTYLRVRGASKSHIIFKHNLKNAMPPMITWLASCAAGLLGGTAIIESVFSIKGIGSVYLLLLIQEIYPQFHLSF